MDITKYCSYIFSFLSTILFLLIAGLTKREKNYQDRPKEKNRRTENYVHWLLKNALSSGITSGLL